MVQGDKFIAPETSRKDQAVAFGQLDLQRNRLLGSPRQRGLLNKSWITSAILWEKRRVIWIFKLTKTTEKSKISVFFDLKTNFKFFFLYQRPFHPFQLVEMFERDEAMWREQDKEESDVCHLRLIPLQGRRVKSYNLHLQSALDWMFYHIMN